MFFILVFVLLFVLKTAAQRDLAAQQIEEFKRTHPEPIGILSTSYGVPVNCDQATNSINTNLISNPYIMESLTHAVRERIPVRTVHSKGTGAIGYLEITDDITRYCRAEVFSEIGKRTPVAVRFSIAYGGKSSSDTRRGIRGMAIKMYTEGGNLDLLCINTPMYYIKDPLFFPFLPQLSQTNPATGLVDMEAFWDFITLRPEALYQNLYLFGDRGIPDGYRHIPAYPIHTMQVVNKGGQSYFIRIHLLPDAGIKNMQNCEAMKFAGEDADYSARDLYDAIAKGENPSWTMYVQILTIEQVRNATFNVFDITKILPQREYPLRRVAKLVLNKNPDNQFAQVEQLAFNPGNLPDGFVGCPDTAFQASQLTYRQASLYRLGINYDRIPVNRPYTLVYTYVRDGVPPVLDNGRDAPNYYPNTFNGPVPNCPRNSTKLIEIKESAKADNFDQAKDLYENQMTCDERDRMIENIINSLIQVSKILQKRAVKFFTQIHADLGKKVQQGLQKKQKYAQ